MAFNQVGDFWLAPGQSTRVHIALGGLVNEANGAGTISVHNGLWPMGRDQSGAAHGQPAHQEKKPIRLHPGSPSPIVYSVTVTNIGEELAHFTIQGGGNV
jgi:hypothetical protein